MRFEWDEKKAAANLRKRKVGSIKCRSRNRLLVVSHVDRSYAIRMIRARLATRAEGKYASRMRKRSNTIVPDPELAHLFPNSQAVNSALRSLSEIARRQ